MFGDLPLGQLQRLEEFPMEHDSGRGKIGISTGILKTRR
jgi:hypothetical protein